MLDLRAAFERDGYAILDELLEPDVIDALANLSDPLLIGANRARPGLRRVFEKQPGFIDVLRSTRVPALLESLVAGPPRIVRTILFDKSPETNWMVPWHQDAVIAVRERCDASGFGPWSVKEGEPHCRPPREVLDRIAVLRLSIDSCDVDNGPLQVIPRSHAHGLVTSDQLDQLVSQGPVVECCTPAGGAVLMRPHTVHSSPRSANPSQRRILHLEFTDADLPAGLEWAESTFLERGFSQSSPP